MIHIETNCLSLEFSAIYDGPELVNYEVLERHFDGAEIRTIFINKRDMQAYIRDLIRGI